MVQTRMALAWEVAAAGASMLASEEVASVLAVLADWPGY
jgi:hypothetical protein